MSELSEKPLVSTSVRIPLGDYAKLQEKAKEEGISLSDVVRKAIREYIKGENVNLYENIAERLNSIEKKLNLALKVLGVESE